MVLCGCQCSLYLPLWRHGLVYGLCLWHFLAILICFGSLYLVLLNEINKTESDTFNIKWALVCGVWLWVCHFPIGIMGQVWYLFVTIPDLRTVAYLVS